jgi:hypothetical protein
MVLYSEKNGCLTSMSTCCGTFIHCDSVTLELSVSFIVNVSQFIIDWLAGAFFLLITLWVRSVHKLKSISTRSGCIVSIFSFYTGGLEISICLSSSTSKLTRVATGISLVSSKELLSLLGWSFTRHLISLICSKYFASLSSRYKEAATSFPTAGEMGC